MKKFSTSFIALVISIVSYGQLEVTVYGDPTDSTVLRQKMALEKKGFNVKVKPEVEKEKPSDNEFINKWTNKKMPVFELTDLTGQQVSNEDFKEKIIHINFWSVTCKPCIEEFPELNELKEKYKDQVIFISIAPENAKKVNRILSRHNLEYQNIADAATLFDELGINGYPKNVFVNEDGIIEKIIDGTHYTIGEKNGKAVMVPDNFKYYDEVLANMTSIPE